MEKENSFLNKSEIKIIEITNIEEVLEKNKEEMIKADRKSEIFGVIGLKNKLKGKEKNIYSRLINEVLNEAKRSLDKNEVPAKEIVKLTKKILSSRCLDFVNELIEEKDSSFLGIINVCLNNNDMDMANKIISSRYTSLITKLIDGDSNFLNILNAYLNNNNINIAKKILSSRCFNLISKLINEDSNFLNIVDTCLNNNDMNMVEKILNSKYYDLIVELIEKDSNFLRMINARLINNDIVIVKKILYSQCIPLIESLSGIDKNGIVVHKKGIFINAIENILSMLQRDANGYERFVEAILCSQCKSLIKLLIDTNKQFELKTISIMTSSKVPSSIYKKKIKQILKTDNAEKQSQIQPEQVNQQLDYKQQACCDHYYYCDQHGLYQIQSMFNQCGYQPNYYQTVTYDPYQIYQQQCQQYQQENYNQQICYDGKINCNYCCDQYGQVDYSRKLNGSKLKLQSKKDCKSREKQLQNLFLAEEEFNDLRKRERIEYDNTPSAKRNF